MGRLHLRCRPTSLRLKGALSLTCRKPRGRSVLLSTPGLTSTVLTRRLCTCVGPCQYGPGGPPALHARFPSVPTSGVRSPVIYRFPTLGFDQSRLLITVSHHHFLHHEVLWSDYKQVISPFPQVGQGRWVHAMSDAATEHILDALAGLSTAPLAPINRYQ